MENKERLSAIENIRLYTLTELEGVLGVTHRTLLSYVKDQKIKATKIGGKWKVTEENLRAFIEGRN